MIVATAAALLLTATGSALAQSAAKPDSAEARAAMERAQRLAANPMKVILQAGKFRRKGAEPDAGPEAVEPASVRRTAARTGAAPEAAAPATAANLNKLPAVVQSSAPVPVAAAPTPEAPAAPRLMPASLLAGSAQGAVPAIEVALPADPGPAVAKAVAPRAIPIAAQTFRPTLVAMVEPEIPIRLLADSGRVDEILADLSLREDGTVAEVALLPPVPRNWKPYLTAALAKWRFEPLVGGARVHRVQLVFDER